MSAVISGALTGLAVLASITLLLVSPGWVLAVSVVMVAVWMASTRIGVQAGSVALLGVATMRQRLGSCLVIVVGIAGVVAVFVALMAMGVGFESTLRRTGTADTVLVIHQGSSSEINSVIEPGVAAVVSQMPEVRRNPQGQPISSSERLVIVSLPSKSQDLDANVALRGVGERIWELHQNARIIAGRKFRPGLRELTVGAGVRKQYSGLEIGSTLSLSGQSWTVVGIFDSADSYDSEIWADVDLVGSVYRRGGGVASITARLTDAGAFDSFKAALAGDPRLMLEAQTTQEYYSQQSEGPARLIRTLGTVVGGIMAVGAIFGALNTMYSAVAARTREIAMLRAIGFSGVPVVVSVLLETMLLAVLGGAVGAAVAWTAFDGFTASTLGGNFSQVVFAFNVSPDLIEKGFRWALALGLIGGIFPAIRAARISVTGGLREL
jgi:putative ABC transport system permease protein